MKSFLQGLRDPSMTPSALRVALIVGTILFSINHGNAFLKGKMNSSRWLSSLLTYAVPYCVNIHGQVSSRKKMQRQLLEQNLNSEKQATAVKYF